LGARDRVFHKLFSLGGGDLKNGENIKFSISLL
jgi:hypothetical protein